MTVIGGRAPITGQDNYSLREQLYQLRQLVSDLVLPASYFDINGMSAGLTVTTGAGATAVTFIGGSGKGVGTNPNATTGEVVVTRPGLYQIYAKLSLAATANAYAARLALQTIEPGGSWADYDVTRVTKSTINTNSAVPLGTLVAVRTTGTRLRLTLTAESNDITTNTGNSNYFRATRIGPVPIDLAAF